MDGSEWSHGHMDDSGLDLSAAFHTYGVSWTAGTITFEFDGVSYGTVDRSALATGENWVFDTTGFFLLVNLAVGGNWPGPPDATTAFPQTMTVDYVRVYP
jgi:beta-glucanase (GH16 family)